MNKRNSSGSLHPLPCIVDESDIECIGWNAALRERGKYARGCLFSHARNFLGVKKFADIFSGRGWSQEQF